MLGKILHRVTRGRLDVAVVIADDLAFLHPHGTAGAKGIHPPSPPDRITFLREDDALMNVKGPSVIARQPCLIGRVRDKKDIQIERLHGGPCFG